MFLPSQNSSQKQRGEKNLANFEWFCTGSWTKIVDECIDESCKIVDERVLTNPLLNIDEDTHH